MAFGWQGWFTIAVIALAFICLLRDLAPADVVFLFSLVVLMTAQVITIEQGLEGFSSQAVLSVAMLYTVAAGISGTGALDYIMNKVLGHPTRLVDAQVKLMFPIAIISAFLNNTPVVAVMIPIVQQWARKIHIPPTYVFIPLSFASILGGTCTLIGTSTNLVLQGKAEQSADFAKANITVGIFDISTVGVPTLFVGFTYIFIFTKLLLPGVHDLERRQQHVMRSRGTPADPSPAPSEEASDKDSPTADAGPARLPGAPAGFSGGLSQDKAGSFASIVGTDVAHLGDLYTAGCIVSPGSSVCGKSVQAAGLRSLEHLFLTSVQRSNQMLGPRSVGPEFVLNAGDILFFAGVLSKFAKFCKHFNFTPIVLDDSEEDWYDSEPPYTDSEFGDSDWEQSSQRRRVAYGSDRSPAPDWFEEASPRHDSKLDTALPSQRQATSDGQQTAVRRRKLVVRRRPESVRQEKSQAGGDGPKRIPRYAAQVRSPRMHPGTQLLDHHLVKAQIGEESSLIGKTPKQVNFRKRFNAAIMSIKRDGDKLGTVSGAGRVCLGAGDVLVLLINEKFDWAALEKDGCLERMPVHVPQLDLGPGVCQEPSVTKGEVAEDPQDGVSEKELAELEREFLVSMRVLDSSKFRGATSLVGQTVEASGLRGLPGLFLVAIEHEDGTTDHAVGSEAVLQKGDVLWFAGERSAVATLRRIPGLEAPADTQIHKLKVNLLERRLVEAVLSLRSEMIGQTIKQARFRTRFDAAVIAVHRRGTRVISKIGDIVLEAGDVLLLDTGPDFMAKFRDNSNFLLVAEIENSTPPRFDKFYLALFSVLGMMMGYLFTSEFMSLFQWSVFAAAIMLLSGCITLERARNAINWEVIVTIACAFGISNALQESGVALTFGQALVSLAETTGTGEPGVLVAIYLATFLLSIVVANNAAALLMFPIALEATISLGFDLNHMLFTLMLAASSSFASPFGYQTNLMVFGPGRYVFGDFLRFGFPLQVWQMVFSVVIVLFDEYWYVSWLLSVAIAAIAYLGMRSIHSPSRSPGCSSICHLPDRLRKDGPTRVVQINEDMRDDSVERVPSNGVVKKVSFHPVEKTISPGSAEGAMSKHSVLSLAEGETTTVLENEATGQNDVMELV